MPHRHRRDRTGRTTVAAVAVGLVLAALALAAGGCGDHGPRAHRGPILFVTFDALRADAVGALGGPPRLTPALDRLARDATWAGRAIAPSSWTVPSMASLFTGLQPWRNQNWHGEAAVLRPELVTLAESLKAAGFSTTAFRSNFWLRERYGYNQGFDTFRYLREGRRAEAKLAQLGDRPELVWAHILLPHAPYERHDAMLDRLPETPPALPRRLSVLDLEPYFDPAVPLPPRRERVFRAMYQLNVAWGDQMLGRMLDALRRSGQYDHTLIVVTADHGEEFKECGQVEHGGSLCRPLVEVPLLIKLPRRWQGPPLALRAGERPATIRVPATLIEAAGGKPEPRTAPSLFHQVSGGVLSELYLGNGVNRFSLVEGDRQLLWDARFAPEDPDYYRARMIDLGGKPQVAPRQPSAVLFAALENAFGRTLPLTGAGATPPALTLWRWVPPPVGSPPMTSVIEPLADPTTLEAMARRLRAIWLASNGSEVAPGSRAGAQPRLTQEEAAEVQALGYAAGHRRQ